MEIENQDGRLSNELFSFPVLNFSYIWAVNTPLNFVFRIFSVSYLLFCNKLKTTVVHVLEISCCNFALLFTAGV